MKGKIYITDCEGPVTKNDNAYEIAEEFLKEGGKLFSLLSKFDDYLGDIEKIDGYRTGSTLKFILPFLKAAGVTDSDVSKFSRQHITVMTNVIETLSAIREFMDVYIISTSYIHYIEAVRQLIGVDTVNSYCTRVSFNDYMMEAKEREMLRAHQEAFLRLPSITWDSENNISADAQYTIETLKDFFFSVLPEYPVYRWMDQVVPIGGSGKAETLMKIARLSGTSMEDIMYVGDSITDVEALTLLQEKGGVSVSFNGNSYAVFTAEYIVVSSNARIFKDIASDFHDYGKKGIRTGKVTEDAYVYTKDIRALQDIIRQSEKMRKDVRGQAIGGLG